MVKIIGALDEDQKAMIHLLEEAIKEVKSGHMKTVGIIACMDKGPAWVMAGSQAANLFLGASMMQDDIKARLRENEGRIEQVQTVLHMPGRRQ